MSKVQTALAALSLGESAVISGVLVTRRSLLGFEVKGSPALADAAEAKARIEALEKIEQPASPLPTPSPPVSGGERRPIVRVLVCTRCGGDGLGRRNRGACGLCRGPGVQVVMPLGGFSEARPEELASAVNQTLRALPAARHRQARESLLTLLAAALRFASPSLKERALTALGQSGFEAAAATIAAAVGHLRAA